MKNREQLVKILRTQAQAYLSVPGVTSVGLGYKLKDGSSVIVDGEREVTIQYTVEKKVSLDSLEAIGITSIPPLFKDDGFVVSTDVVERSFKPSYQLVPLEEKSSSRTFRRSRQEVVQPGISISNVKGTAGTIGAIVYDRSTGQPYALSNWHILHGPFHNYSGNGTRVRHCRCSC